MTEVTHVMDTEAELKLGGPDSPPPPPSQPRGPTAPERPPRSFRSIPTTSYPHPSSHPGLARPSGFTA